MGMLINLIVVIISQCVYIYQIMVYTIYTDIYRYIDIYTYIHTHTIFICKKMKEKNKAGKHSRFFVIK